MDFNMYVPTKILFGAGTLNELGKQQLPGKKAVIIISNGKSTRANGYLSRTEEQLAGIRESAKINTALLDYISANIREGMSTAEIDHMVYEFTTDHDAIPAPFMYEGFPKSVCTSINEEVCHGIPDKNIIFAVRMI